MIVPAKDPPEVLERFTAALPIVKQYARTISRNVGAFVSPDELESFGAEALLLAAREYDPNVVARFEPWAAFRVRAAIFEGVRVVGRSRDRLLGEVPHFIKKQLRAFEAADRVAEAQLEEAPTGVQLTPEAADRKLTDYLAGIATAMATGYLAGEHEGGEPLSSEGSPEEAVAEAELAQRIRAAVSALPDLQRKLVELRIFKDVPFADIARELEISPGWAHRLLAQAMDSVTRELKKMGVRA